TTIGTMTLILLCIISSPAHANGASKAIRERVVVPLAARVGRPEHGVTEKQRAGGRLHRGRVCLGKIGEEREPGNRAKLRAAREDYERYRAAGPTYPGIKNGQSIGMQAAVQNATDENLMRFRRAGLGETKSNLRKFGLAQRPDGKYYTNTTIDNTVRSGPVPG